MKGAVPRSEPRRAGRLLRMGGKRCVGAYLVTVGVEKGLEVHDIGM